MGDHITLRPSKQEYPDVEEVAINTEDDIVSIHSSDSEEVKSPKNSSVAINAIKTLFENNDESNTSEDVNYYCSKCKKTFKHKRNYIFEKSEEDIKANEIYKCITCLNQHLDEEKDEKYVDFKQINNLRCKRCYKIFINSKTLKAHKQKRVCKPKAKKISECPFCNYRAVYKGLVEKHIMKIHVDESENITERLHCYNCSFNCVDKESLISHMETHVKNKLVCNICKEEFRQDAELKIHISNKHAAKVGDDLYKCKDCDYKCNKRVALQRHLKTHMTSMTFDCHLCDKSYSKRNALNYHLFKCHYKEFKRISNKLNCKVHSCKSCNYETLDLNRLKLHHMEFHAKK